MNKLSTYSLGICYVIMLYAALLFYPKWKQARTEATLSWDVSGYYMYLPAIFIYNDIQKCAFKDSILEKYGPTPDFQQAITHEPTGNYVMKYSSGQAITMLPWFAIAHIWAKSSNQFPADGFSFPYQICIGLGMFLYALIGLFYLRKLLLNYFKDSTVAIVLPLFVAGTNYLNYACIDQAMTHSTLFVIYVFVILNTIAYHRNPSTQKAIGIGLLCGLATLIRPTDIISILIPILWEVNSVKDIKNRISFFFNKYLQTILFTIALAVVVFIQPIYWKLVTNHWIVYSYQDQGFSWLHPHIKDYLLSYRCGWLRYCPMMILPLLALIPYAFKGYNRLLICLFSILSLYIVSAWDVWDYGGTAGRAMVQYYPVLAFPFAFLIEEANKKTIFKTMLYPIILLFVYLNIWWFYNAHGGSICISESSREYYWKKVGRWHATENDTKLLDNKYAFDGVPQNVTPVYSNNFAADTSQNVFLINNNKVIRINNTLQYSLPYQFDKPSNTKKWFRFTGKFEATTKEWDMWKQAQFIVKFFDKGQEVQTNAIRLHRFLNDGEIKEIYFDAIAPKNWDKASILLWNSDGNKELYLSSLNAIMFDE